ncbi:FG-GAP-like repeat-containing protein [Streptomyces uncialis]|uniref:FG-GAP-like repeat-containing protein n=1 Tax=Streptomyces uncialis TaxID=1048205 RepID=UPI0011613279|nr:FG-GAP-like repeat-containing protein [Streptomyces uncialis]
MPARSTDDGSVSEEDKALQDAIALGQPVELLSARTETSDTWVRPDGSFSVVRHGAPVRLWRNGAWVAADATLVFAADGSVVPKASRVDVTFSGGGTGPMLTGVKDGRTLSLTWTKPLPAPTLAGNVATYAEVLPGVDLQLKADVEGFSQLLVVKNAQAAAHPDLAQLRFTMATVGVTVTEDPNTGALEATDPAGQTVFTSPTPLMWDSTPPPTAPAARTLTATSTPQDTFEPGAGAKNAEMPTAVAGDTLTITPDQRLLTGASTTYPVYIDPSWAFGEWQHWARVYQAFPTTSYWDAKGDVRVGYESQTGGQDRISRSFFQLDTSGVRGAQIKSATFRIRNTWSWSCQKRAVQVWRVEDISKRTTWNHQPGQLGGTPLDTVTDAKGWGDGCPAGNLEFNATSAVRTAAAADDPSVTLGLYAADESDTFGWKRFDPKTARLEIDYNNPPKTPTGLGTNPRTSCANGGVIGNAQVSVYAKIDDPEAGMLTAQFQVVRTDLPERPVVLSRELSVAKGRHATLVLPATSVPTGTYSWKVRAKDGDGATSAWSATCAFSMDRTRPASPPGITSRGNAYPNGDNGWPNPTGPARAQTEFVFSSGGVTDVASYHWWTSGDSEVQETPVGAPSAFVTPPSYGPHMIHAYSVDRAGNRSDTATYLYYANRSRERDKPGDLNGDGYKDIWSTDANGTLLTYAGEGNREFSSATHGGGTFPGRQVAFHGDWISEDGHNDLISLEHNANDNTNQLKVYKSSGRGTIDREDYLRLRARSAALEHWRTAEQIATADLNADGKPDILVKQGKRLWLYYGNRTVHLDTGRAPVLVGETDWDQFTPVLPGDLNKDDVPDLLLRHNASGDVYRAYGKKGPHGALDTATWGAAGTRVRIATGMFPASTHPSIGTSGDLDGDDTPDGSNDGDGIPDIWVRKADNTLNGHRGIRTGDDYTGIGSAYLIDGVNGGRRIAAGTTLTPGQSVSSPSATLTMRADGDLVLTSTSNQKLWSSGTAGNNGATALVRGDGHITVNSAVGVLLWSSGPATATGEGYALLQDRGNLVVHNAKGHSLWTSGGAPRHDHNRDGRSDVAAWYDYADGKDALLTFDSLSDGTFTSWRSAWTAPAGDFDADNMKRVTGDFNGDGIGDAAALYGYVDGRVSLWTWTGKPDGTFNRPFRSWDVKPGHWTFQRMTPYSGDFNGDGRDDIAVWYDYHDGRDTAFVFSATVKGGFNHPVNAWSASSGWEHSRSKVVTGDFNGDGRDDLAAMYDYPDGSEKLWTFAATPTGSFARTASWTSTTWGDWSRTTLHAGDFNGDGRDDIATWYDYADGHDAVNVFSATPNGTFTGYHEAWTSPAGTWYRPHLKLVIGDYNGDGRDDIGGMYGYSDGSVRMYTWTAKADGKLNGAANGWSAPTGNWTFSRSAFLERYP